MTKTMISRAVTHADASRALLNALAERGWSVGHGAKVQHATHPAGDFRLWLRTTGAQSFYTSGGVQSSESLPSARHRRPLPFPDLRVAPLSDVIEYLDRMQENERRQLENFERRMARLEAQGVKRPPTSNVRLTRLYLGNTR